MISLLWVASQPQKTAPHIQQLWIIKSFISNGAESGVTNWFKDTCEQWFMITALLFCLKVCKNMRVSRCICSFCMCDQHVERMVRGRMTWRAECWILSLGINSTLLDWRKILQRSHPLQSITPTPKRHQVNRKENKTGSKWTWCG